MWRKARNASEKQLAANASMKSKTVCGTYSGTDQSAAVEKRRALRNSMLADIRKTDNTNSKEGS